MHQRSTGNGAPVMRKGSRAMKRFLFLGVGSALVFTMSGVGTAQADNGPHVSTAALPNTTVTLGVNRGNNVGGTRCASCHRAHETGRNLVCRLLLEKTNKTLESTSNER